MPITQHKHHSVIDRVWVQSYEQSQQKPQKIGSITLPSCVRIECDSMQHCFPPAGQLALVRIWKPWPGKRKVRKLHFRSIRSGLLRCIHRHTHTQNTCRLNREGQTRGKPHRGGVDKAYERRRQHKLDRYRWLTHRKGVELLPLFWHFWPRDGWPRRVRCISHNTSIASLLFIR